VVAQEHHTDARSVGPGGTVLDGGPEHAGGLPHLHRGLFSRPLVEPVAVPLITSTPQAVTTGTTASTAAGQ
jgi:hypothetical protein